MERESWDVLGSRVGECLEQLVEASLLQALHIVLHLVVQRQLVLVEVELVSRCDDDYLVVVIELRLADLLRELWVRFTA